MSLNWIGLLAATTTFMGIWIGHVSVRKIEYISPTVWVRSGLALFIGLLLELGALMSEDLYLSASLGIFGITVLWDALEYWRQHRRVQKGHAPANPENPRHARMLQTKEMSTTIDWLNRNPTGRQLSKDELQAILDGAR